MSTNHQSHEGYVEYKMDPKFRVSIPVDWRPADGEILRLQMSKSYEMPVIKVLTVAAFEERVATIEASETLTPAAKKLKLGKLHMHCKKVTLNEQGKLLVPKDWSEKAGLTADKEVVLAGRGKHFEIWNPEGFKRLIEIESASDDEDELGVF